MRKYITTQPMKNMHVPLPEPVYQRLRTEARRTRRPATVLAREAIDLWLAEQHRSAVHEEVATYAKEAAGTGDDLDRDLEAAGIDLLRKTKRKRKKDGDR
ncbi:MAG: hypothetical protein HY608_09490 [Planctomycetes bacterium]|nr:hypothetical protein [Planctomycetota bacterium]